MICTVKVTYTVIEDYGKTSTPNKCFTCVMTHMITKPDEMTHEFNKFSTS